MRIHRIHQIHLFSNSDEKYFFRGARFYKAEIMYNVPNVTVIKCGTSGTWYDAVILKSCKRRNKIE